MKRVFLVIVFLGFISPVLVAQPGHYFLSHYKPGNENISNISYDIHQSVSGVLYFANQKGVLQFDGRNWTMVPVHGAVYSLTSSVDDQIFAGGSAGFGRIGLNQDNRLAYISLSDSLPDAKNIFVSYTVDSVIYFLNEQSLFQFDIAKRKSSRILAAEPLEGPFTGLFRLTSGMYVSTENGGLKKIVKGSLQSLDIVGLQEKQLIFSELSPDGKKDFIATDDSRFFIKVKGIPLREFKPKDSLYLKSGFVVNATWVNDQMVAIGTLRGGVVFVDVESDDTYEISNYYSGLPDNEIYAVHTDRHKGVWVAHDYGFTRVAPFLPFRTFNHYKGLQGNLLCAITDANQVYVGTTLGLFRLSREEIYEDEVYSVTKTITRTTPGRIKSQPEVVQDRKKSKPGLFGIFKKKKEMDELSAEVQRTAAKITKTKVTQTKTRKVLKGIEYLYKPVEGITGKVDQLIRVEKRLLCSGVGGVFEVSGLNSTSISPEPIRTIFYSKNLRQLLLCTYDDKIQSFQPADKAWNSVEFPDSLSIYADFMFEDNLQNLWVCGHDRAIKIGIEGREILDAETIPLPHSSIDRTVGLAYGDEVYLTQNGEFFHYASYKNEFIKYDSLPGPKRYFASDGVFWFYDGHKWRTVDKKKQGSIKTEWLSLFPDIRFLAPADPGKSLWVITSANELYRFSGDQDPLNQNLNPLFLKEIRNQQIKLAPQTSWKVDESESAMTLEFIQPEYVGEQAVEYRYYVQGLQTQWSEWSSINNIINFSFLPPGEYRVLIQSKDLFDKITELNSIHFDVTPPYWKRPWFYAVEFLFFGSLVVLSLRLNVSNSRYRYLSRFLSALTVVMLIQFIQTIASANITMKSTPVADFFIQVFIALLVLPVEEFLRNRMVKAAEKKH
ncbi:MAG TPA: triple tyrosine motif-containing protein [Cyclobacteriaceae bacterium]|nr:triple tyrosine motif-containing protein [Cyclobacteriaceae bacterium]